LRRFPIGTTGYASWPAAAGLKLRPIITEAAEKVTRRQASGGPALPAHKCSDPFMRCPRGGELPSRMAGGRSIGTKPSINHPTADHLDMVTLVCYGFAILHSCVCTLPACTGWESSAIPAAFRACIQPRVSNE
jgi:hypothetical protein